MARVPAAAASAGRIPFGAARRAMPWRRMVRAWRRDYGPAILLLTIGAISLAAATLSPTGKNGQYAVVAPPWFSVGQTIALIQAANGEIADIRADTRIVIAHSEKPGFVGDLYQSGAWLVLDPVRIRGCSGASSKNSKEQA